MALFVIGDLHLATSVPKPMDIFGGNWDNHAEKICSAWKSLVSDEDTVVVCGDSSWGINLDEALSDFKLIDSLPGKKLLLKGNHDYWWTTASKMNTFLAENNIASIEFLHNNCFAHGDIAICGSRGWFNRQSDNATDDAKMQLREAQRIMQSASLAKKQYPDKQLMLFLHYPPYYNGEECIPVMDAVIACGASDCWFGHIHSTGIPLANTGEYKGVQLHLVSCDAINFTPMLVK